MTSVRRICLGVSFAASLLAPAIALAQPGGAGPAPVRYTEARRGEVRPTIELTGSVEARRISVVASEVAGKVVSLDAREGDRVRRGAPLARLRQENLQLSLDAARASLEEARARRELAEANLKRARDLFAEEVVSRQLLDDATSEQEALKARVEQLQAQVRRLEDDLERSTIRAPFPGVVVAEHTAEGEWVSPGDPVVELMDVEELEVTLQVPERHFAGLEVGTKMPVVLESVSRLPVEGTIRAVVPRADPRARTFPVKVGIPNEGGRVGVGMLAKVRLPTGEPVSGVLVPKDALVEGRAGSIVYVIGPDQTVRPVEVRTGIAEGPWIAVEGAVEAGDRVVTRGNERLRPGAQVQAEPQEYPGS